MDGSADLSAGPASSPCLRVGGDLRRGGRATAYGGRVSRKPAFLAALASSAVPGLDPVSVQGAVTEPGHYHEVAFVTDTQHRKWVVRAPLTPAAGAQMDTTVALLQLIGRRLPFSVPAPRGFVAVPEGRAVVYPHLPGRPVDFASLPAGPGLAAEVGRAIAAVHNIDRAVFDEAGLPIYAADEYRTRRLADLDRAAATGHVPTALLSRWERALEEVSIWRFAPTPVHGGLTGEQVLVAFESDDASSGRVRGITGWDDAKVADPAEDLATLISACTPEAFESVLEAYAHSRVERPDRHLRRRARLASELRVLGALLSAVSAGERDLVTARVADLRELDEHTVDEPDEGPVAQAPAAPVVVAQRSAPHQADSGHEPGRVPSDADSTDTADWTDAARAARQGPAADSEPGQAAVPERAQAAVPERARAADSEGAQAAVAERAPAADDDGERTQPMNAGRFSEPTTVIPQDELEKLRRGRGSVAGQPGGSAPAEATANRESEPEQSSETERPHAAPGDAEAGAAEPVTSEAADVSIDDLTIREDASEDPATRDAASEGPATRDAAREGPATRDAARADPATREAATVEPPDRFR